MCLSCDLARETYGFDLAECPQYLMYLEEKDFQDNCILAQDEMEARGGPFPMPLDEIPF